MCNDLSKSIIHWPTDYPPGLVVNLCVYFELTKMYSHHGFSRWKSCADVNLETVFE